MVNTMLAARYVAPDRLETRVVEQPEIGKGEALIRIEACGFCGSDLNIVAGTHPRAVAPLTIGHELAGTVVELAEDHPTIVVGDRVTMFPLISCGRCHACRHGHAHVCRELKLFGFDVDGGMSDYIRLPIDALMKLPPDMPPLTGALIEPLAVAVHALRFIDAADTRVAAILGAGPIGLLTALVAKAAGIEHVLISDPLARRLDLARSLGLATAKAGDTLADRIDALTDNEGADAVFECAGHASSAAAMTGLARSRGTLVVVGVAKQPVPVDLQAINFKELMLRGSRVYSRTDFEEAIALAPSLPLDRIVSHRFGLGDVVSAFAQFRGGEACKVLIEPWSGRA